MRPLGVSERFQIITEIYPCADCGAQIHRIKKRGRKALFCLACKKSRARIRNLRGGRVWYSKHREHLKKAISCRSCGKAVVGRNRKYCDDCRRGRRCVDCGCSVASRSIRCKPCRARFQIKASNHRVCEHCRKPYIRKRRNHGEGLKYCSQQCAGAAKKSRPPSFSVVHQSKCGVCGKEWIGRRKQAICSDGCRKEIRRTQSAVALFREAVQKRPTASACLECGVAFTPIKFVDSPFCCPEHSKAYYRRIVKALRKARLLGSRYEDVDPIKVFERDGWRCRACGCDAPRRLRGSLDDNAPELDHVVPLAAGGEHTYDNTQCLCRLCNQLKSDMPMPQFLATYGASAHR